MQASHFDSIHIICNPKSTGPSVKYARELQRELHRKHAIRSEIHKTEYAGHAEKLAYDLSCSSKRSLIISSSGDGGYNEVINGVMKAIEKGKNPVCAVLPAGNANDHARFMGITSLTDSIHASKVRKLDVLRLRIESKESLREKFAHSYIGFGLTPSVAMELNATNLNIFKEVFIVAKNILFNRPFHILHKEKMIALDSLVFSNIGEMAKILTFAKNAEPDDGKFEVTIFPHRGKSDLVRRLWHATRGIDQSKHFATFSFRLVNTTHVQLDGEVQKIPAQTKINIMCIKQAYDTLA